MWIDIANIITLPYFLEEYMKKDITDLVLIMAEKQSKALLILRKEGLFSIFSKLYFPTAYCGVPGIG